MVFPATKLGLAAELLLGGTWTDITSPSYVLGQGTPPVGITIGRGRADEVTSATPSSCAMRLNNNDGRFSPRNPAGPYYGQLVRNTPLRVSVPASGTYLRIEDDRVSFVFAASSAGLNITGDIEVQLDLALTTYVPSVLASKDNAAAQRAWSVRLNGDGTVGWYWYDSGSVQHLATSQLPLPLGRISLRVTLAVASGTVTFYTSTTPINSSPSWTQLGVTTVAGATSILSTTNFIAVGANTNITAAAPAYGGPAGAFYGFRILSGISGTLQGSPDFTTATPGASTLTDAQGNTWTLNGTAVFSNRAYRFHGECASLPQEQDVTGHEVWTPLTASGPLRRLQQGTAPLKSVMRRGVTAFASGPSSAGVSSAPQTTLAYWPCEDAAGSTQIASGIAVNGDGIRSGPMMLAGLPAFQAATGSPSPDSTFACSLQLPQVGSSRWTGPVPGYSSAATAWSAEFLLVIPSGGIGATVTLAQANTGGPSSAGNLALQYATASGGTLSLVVNLAGTTTVTGPTGANGQAYWVQLANVGTGGTQAYATILPLGQGASTTVLSAASALASLAGVIVNPGSANLGATVIGQIWASAAFSSTSAIPAALPSLSGLANLLNAYAGEPAASRVARLAGENSLQARIYGYPQVSAPMGVQSIDTLVNLLQACEDADRGVLYEPRQCLGIAYRTNASLCNQAPAVTLDFASPADEISPPLLPVDDDQFTRNDVTASRSGGSAAQVQVTTGPLSVNPPPAGAGDYATSLTVNCAYDAQLPNIAGWAARVGTADAERFPAVTVDLASTDAAMQALLPAIRDADIGARMVMVNPPGPWLPPDQVSQLLWGTTEQLGDFAWRIAQNQVPEIPYQVAAAGAAHADTAGSQLHSGVTAGATSLTVDVTAGNLWTVNAGDFPFLIRVAGEVMKVTNITGASSPQTFTVVRSVNGVVKAQSANAVIHVEPQPAAALSGAA